MTQTEAKLKEESLGWSVVEDSGRGWRRVVSSPKPLAVVEIQAITQLVNYGAIVISGGGGGIPVVRDNQGNLKGTPAVIDKDFTSSLLAQHLKAELFVISTAVEHVYLDWGKPNQCPIHKITLAQAKTYLQEGGHFGKGSMEPKIQAVIWFLESGGKHAIITNPENLQRALKGDTGTWIVNE